jgi:hypothetical protein
MSLAAGASLQGMKSANANETRLARIRLGDGQRPSHQRERTQVVLTRVTEAPGDTPLRDQVAP